MDSRELTRLLANVTSGSDSFRIATIAYVENWDTANLENYWKIQFDSLRIELDSLENLIYSKLDS